MAIGGPSPPPPAGKRHFGPSVVNGKTRKKRTTAERKKRKESLKEKQAKGSASNKPLEQGGIMQFLKNNPLLTGLGGVLIVVGIIAMVNS